VEQTGNSTLPLGNGKGPEAKKEDCKDQPRKKRRCRSNWPPNPPKTKKQQKNAKKNTVFQVNSGTVYRIFFLVWLFCSSIFCLHIIVLHLSQCVYYIRLAYVIYYSTSTFNKPSRGHRITLRQSFPHVMGIKE